MIWTDNAGIWNIVIFICLQTVMILTVCILREMKKQRRLSVMPKLILTMPKNIQYYTSDPDEEYQKSNYLRFDLVNMGKGAAEDIRILYSVNPAMLERCKWCRVRENKVTISLRRDQKRSYIRTERANLRLSLPQNGKAEIQPDRINRLLYAFLAVYLRKKDTLPTMEKVMDIEIRYRDILKNTYRTAYHVLTGRTEDMDSWEYRPEGVFLSFDAVAEVRKNKIYMSKRDA